MYRITNEQGAVTYKVDIFSRNQVGRGGTNPSGAHYAGSYHGSGRNRELFGGFRSGSSDRETSTIPGSKAVADSGGEFWASEYTAGRLPPQNLENLIIYELHVGSLGFPSTSPGTFADAMAFVDKLVDLGVNAVELLPVLEFDGDYSGATEPRCSFVCRPAPAAGIN